jgi:hypothetical protein
VLFAWVILLVGVVGSLAAATGWRAYTSKEDRRSFDTTSKDVGTAVGTALSRDMDFVATEQTLMAMNPGLSNTEFKKWFDNFGVYSRSQPGIGFGYFEQVSAARLAAFAASVKADPIPHIEVIGNYEVYPPGDRAQYCLLRVGSYTGASALIPRRSTSASPVISPASGRHRRRHPHARRWTRDASRSWDPYPTSRASPSSRQSMRTVANRSPSTAGDRRSTGG